MTRKKRDSCTVTRKKQTAFVYTELNYQRPKVQVTCSKKKGAGQPQGLPRRAHTPICTIGSDQLAIRAEE
jgi:hypothetical protein